MIFFATLKLAEQIHAGCLGFTSMIHEFVEADSQDEARTTAELWCSNKGLKFEKVLSLSVSHQQDPERYVFPEQIIRKGGLSSHRVILRDEGGRP